MSNYIPREVLKQASNKNMNGNEFRIFAYILSFKTNLDDSGVNTISKDLGFSKEYIINTIKKLKKLSLI